MERRTKRQRSPLAVPTTTTASTAAAVPVAASSAAANATNAAAATLLCSAVNTRTSTTSSSGGSCANEAAVAATALRQPVLLQPAFQPQQQIVSSSSLIRTVTTTRRCSLQRQSISVFNSTSDAVLSSTSVPQQPTQRYVVGSHEYHRHSPERMIAGKKVQVGNTPQRKHSQQHFHSHHHQYHHHTAAQPPSRSIVVQPPSTSAAVAAAILFRRQHSVGQLHLLSGNSTEPQPQSTAATASPSAGGVVVVPHQHHHRHHSRGGTGGSGVGGGFSEAMFRRLSLGNILPRRRASHDKQRRKNSLQIWQPSACFTHMMKGSQLLKVRSGNRIYSRFFTLDNDLSAIRWMPTAKKNPEKSKIPITTVKEVRVGKCTESLRNQALTGQYADECAFAIIHGEQFDTLDLIAPSPDEANIWVTGLMSLIGSLLNQGVNAATSNVSLTGSEADPNNIGGGNSFSIATNAAATTTASTLAFVSRGADLRDRWLAQQFRAFDSDNDGLLTENQIIQLCVKLEPNLFHAVSRVQQKMKELIAFNRARPAAEVQMVSDSTDGTAAPARLEEYFDVPAFADIFKDVSTRPEIYHLLVRYANKEYMSCDDLILFLEAEQGVQGCTRAECTRLIDEHEPFDDARALGILGVDGFTRFLLSVQGDIFDKQHEHVCQDMSQPLSSYYIAASHNTYLIEDQLKGPTSIDGYIWALKKGCRSIEIDVWDGTPTPSGATAAVAGVGAAGAAQLQQQAQLQQPSTPRSTSSSVHSGSPLGLGTFATGSTGTTTTTTAAGGGGGMHEVSSASRLSPMASSPGATAPSSSATTTTGSTTRPVPEPMVYHGHTLTSKLPFRAIVEAINEFAFVSTPYPLLIKLEVHCSLLQQYVLVDILRSIFGDKLLTVDELENSSSQQQQPARSVLEALSALPSPEQLLNKIIVVSKRLPLERYYTTTAQQRLEYQQQQQLHDESDSGLAMTTAGSSTSSGSTSAASSVIVNKRGVVVRTLAPLRLLQPSESNYAATPAVGAPIAGEVSEEDEAAESNRQRRFSAQASSSFSIAAVAQAAAAATNTTTNAQGNNTGNTNSTAGGSGGGSGNGSPSATSTASGTAASMIAALASSYSPNICSRACTTSASSATPSSTSVHANDAENNNNILDAEAAAATSEQQPTVTVPPTVTAAAIAAMSSSSPNRSQAATPTNLRHSSARRMKLSKVVSDLVTYLETIPTRAVADLIPNQKVYQMASFSEAYAAKLVNSTPYELTQYTMRYLVRVYPNGMRVDSSNFNPQDMWNCGCQIVSLNYQTPGLMMDLNDARFTINGNCGYVLKPHTMRLFTTTTNNNNNNIIVTDVPADTVFVSDASAAAVELQLPQQQQRTMSTTTRQSFALPITSNSTSLAAGGGGDAVYLSPVDGPGSATATVASVPQVLRIKIISAVNLPKPRGSGSKGDVIDPYVTIELFGVPADCGEERTKTVQNNGFNPIFDESFEFHISMPELCLVRFVVLDDDHIGDDFVGQYTLPFECLQTGYRHVRLKNFQGEQIDGCLLFVHIAITNRRGGGKPTKRGMSVRLPMRKRKQRSVGLKLIGIKPIDDLFKDRAYSLMKEAIELRDTVEAALNTFKEECGLQSMSNLKQCMRLLAARIASASAEHRVVIKIEPSVQQQQSSSLNAGRLSKASTALASPRGSTVAGTEVEADQPAVAMQHRIGGSSEIINIPRLVFDGNADSESVPDTLKRGYTSYQIMVDKCQYMITQAEPLRRRFLAAHAYIMDLYGSSEELSRVCASFGIKQGTKKWTKAVDAFAWNIRLLKGQADIMQQAREECKVNLRQICEAAAATGLLVSSPQGSAPAGGGGDVNGNVQKLGLAREGSLRNSTTVTTTKVAHV